MVVVEKKNTRDATSDELEAEPEAYYRMCDALERLNERVVVEPYFVPKERVLNLEARGASFYSELDNAHGYWQRGIDSRDRHLFAFTLPNGRRVQWTVLPM
eukprot:Pgem_evm1s770